VDGIGEARIRLHLELNITDIDPVEKSQDIGDEDERDDAQADLAVDPILPGPLDPSARFRY
jgi:hypothetical protein